MHDRGYETKGDRYRAQPLGRAVSACSAAGQGLRPLGTGTWSRTCPSPCSALLREGVPGRALRQPQPVPCTAHTEPEQLRGPEGLSSYLLSCCSPSAAAAAQRHSLGPSSGPSPGPSSGLNPGPSPGFSSGLSSGPSSGLSSGLNSGPSPGLSSGLSSGLNS